MGNAYTESDVNEILNQPGVFYFRAFGSAGAYTRTVFSNTSAFNYTPEVFTQEFDAEGDVFDAIGKETGVISFAYGKPFDLDYMSNISGGLFTKTVMTSGAQVVEDQTIAADWTDKDNTVIVLEDADGKTYTANGEPAITSVTASTSGVLAANDDYFIVPDANSLSGYSIMLVTTGTKTVATTESVVIVFNDPTVSTATKLSGGGKKNYDAIEGYFLSALKDGTEARVNFYRGYFSGNLNTSFGSEASPAAVVTDVTINLKNDTTRGAGEQMFDLWIAK